MTPVSTRTLVSALVEIGRKQLTGVSDVVIDGGRIRIVWAQGIPVAAEETGTSRPQSRDPRERNRNAILACLRWEPAGSSFSFRESPDVLRGVPQNPVSMAPLIVLSSRRGFGPNASSALLSARESLCPLLALDATTLAQQLELRPNEAKLLELLDGTASLRNVLTRCDLDEIHSLQLLAVLEVLELVRWGPPRVSARPEVVQTVVVPRHTPMTRPSMPAVRTTPSVEPPRITPAADPRMTPMSPRVSTAPDPRMTPTSPRVIPSDPRMTPMSPRMTPSDPRMTPMQPPRMSVTPPTPAAPTMPPSRPSTMTPVRPSTMTPVRRPSIPAAFLVSGSAPPGSSPNAARLTPSSMPASGRSTPPLSSAEARVEAAALYQEGRASLKAGQTKQAQEQFARAAMLAPEMFEYLLQEALLEYLSATAQEDRERLTRRLEGLVVRALTKDRKLAIAHRVRGYLALATNQDEPALKAFKLAKDLDPDDIDAQRHYLVLMRRRKR